jgi:translocation and assembly module TamB
VEGRARLRLDGAVLPWVTVSGTGTIEPFLEQSIYDVDLTLVQRAAYPLSDSLRMTDSRLRLRARGRGFAPDVAQGSATVTGRADVGQGALRDGRVTAEWGDQSAAARLSATVAGGALEGAATAGWQGDETTVRVSRLVVRDADVAALLGEDASGRMSVEASGAGPGARLAEWSAELRARVDSGRWRSARLDSVVAALELRDGRVVVTGVAGGPPGAGDFRLIARPFETNPEWRLERLQVSDLDLAVAAPTLPRSRIDATLAMELSGADPETLTGGGTLTLDSSQVGAGLVGPGTLRWTLDRGEVRLDGVVLALGGRIELDGRASPLRAVPAFELSRAEFQDVDVAALWGGPRAPLSGVLELRGTAPSRSLPEVTGRLRLDSARVNDGRLQSAVAEFTLEDGQARVNLDARTGSGFVRVEGLANLARRPAATSGEGGWAIDTARLEGTADLPDLAPLLGVPDTDAKLVGAIRLAGRGTDPETMDWTGRLTLASAWDSARVDSLRLDALVRGGRLELDTLLIASNVLDGFGYGAVRLGDRGAVPAESLHVQVRADTTGVLLASPMAARAGLRPFGLRSLRLDLVAGTREGGGLRVSASGGAGGVIAGPLGADSVELAVTVVPREGPFTLQGTVVGRQLAWQRIELERLTARFDRDAARFTFDLEAARDDTHTLELAGGGRMGERRARLFRLGFGFGAERWMLADTATIGWTDGLTVGDFLLQSNGRGIGLDGSLRPEGTQNFTITLDSVPVLRFAEFAGIEGLNGTVHGTAALAGPAERVDLTADLRTSLEGMTGRIRTEPRGRQLGIAVELADPDGNRLEVTGEVPNRLALRTPAEGAAARGDTVALQLRADAFSLGWMTPLLRPAGVDRFEGRIDSEMRLDGLVARPRATGTARIAGGRVTMGRTGLDYRNIDGSMALRGSRLHLDSLRLVSSGTATITGEVILEPLDNPRFELVARFDGFRAMRNEWVALALDGRATVTGDLARPSLGGAVTLVRTDVFADRVGQGTAVRPVELTARDYAMLESYFGYRTAPTRGSQDPLYAWSIDLDLTLGGDVWLRKHAQPEMRILLDGSLDVRKESGDSLRLFGSVRAVPGRSVVEQLNRRFEIAEGTITFNGPLSGWRADINARHAVPAFQDPSASEVVITMQISGGAENLRLTLGSEPAMETTDVLSYLATGRPAASAAEFGALNGNDGLSGRGASLAIGTAASLLEQQGSERIGLDVVEIRQDGPDGTTVVAGRYVSPRLYVGFQQPVSERRPEDGIDQTGPGTQVEVEYQAFRWLLLNLQGGPSELRWFFRTRHAF